MKVKRAISSAELMFLKLLLFDLHLFFLPSHKLKIGFSSCELLNRLEIFRMAGLPLGRLRGDPEVAPLPRQHTLGYLFYLCHSFF